MRLFEIRSQQYFSIKKKVKFNDNIKKKDLYQYKKIIIYLSYEVKERDFLNSGLTIILISILFILSIGILNVIFYSCILKYDRFRVQKWTFYNYMNKPKLKSLKIHV